MADLLVELSCYTKILSKEMPAMGHNYSTTIAHDRERGQHLNFEDRVSIKIDRQQRSLPFVFCKTRSGEL